MYRVAIIEDDLLSQEALKDILNDYCDEFKIVAFYTGVKESIENLPKIDVDLVLLDMELSDGQGFDILKSLEDIKFEVIITTMYDSFMLEAIKHSAIDYLLKPISKEDMGTSLERFEKKKERLESLKSTSSKHSSSRLAIPNQHGLVLVEISDLVRLESDGAYTKLFVSDGSTHLISKNLGYYEETLADHDFLRIHNKHLINISHIKNYLRKDGGHLVMTDDSHVDVSRRKKQVLLNALKSEL
jgi:two-component system LytT family response regulator